MGGGTKPLTGAQLQSALRDLCEFGHVHLENELNAQEVAQAARRRQRQDPDYPRLTPLVTTAVESELRPGKRFRVESLAHGAVGDREPFPGPAPAFQAAGHYHPGTDNQPPGWTVKIRGGDGDAAQATATADDPDVALQRATAKALRRWRSADAQGGDR